MCLSVAAIKKNDSLNWYDCVWKLRIAAFVSLSVVVVVVVVVPVAIIRTTAPGSFDRGIDTITRGSSSSSNTVGSGVASMSMTRIDENGESPTNGIGNGGDPQIDLDGLNSNHQQQQLQQQKQQEDPSNQLPPQWHQLSTYDLTRSTEMNYKMDLQKGFTGRYTHVRSTLDYTYHSNYIPQRQLLQDSIIDLLLTNGNGMDHTHNHNNNRDDDDDDDDSRNDKHTNRHHHQQQQPQHTNPTNTKTPSSSSSQSSNNTPWIVFTAGAMGAGKSYTIRHLASTTPQRFPLQRFITVDPDEIRRLLPEFDSYLTPPTATEEGGSSTHRPELAGELTRKEAGMIAEILAEVALGEGRNVLVDGSLKDSDWYRGYFDRLRNEYGGESGGGGLRIGILHVTAPRDAIFERARIRAKTTGRIVPQHTLEESIEKVPKSIRLLAPLVDFFAQLHNAPNATDVELVTEGMTWESFRQVWSPTTTITTRCSSIYPTLRTTTNTIDSGEAVNAWDNELDNNIFFGYHQATAAATTCSNRDAAEVVRDEFFGYRWQQDQVLSRL